MEQLRTECNFGGRGNVRVSEPPTCQVERRFPEHGELPDLADVLKCIAIECDTL